MTRHPWAARSRRWLLAALAVLAMAHFDAATARSQEPAAQPRASTPDRSLLQTIQDGGPLMVPIIGCSILLMVFGIERGMALRRGRVAPAPFVKRLLHQVGDGKLDREAALKLCRENHSPVALVLAAGLRKWGKPAVEIEQAVMDAGERAANGLRKHLRVFSGVASVSPLLGLLGTVLGMIRAFNDIASSDAMGRPDLLATGISEALFTTAGGLLVAIPAMAMSLFFVSRVDQLIVELDGYGEQLVNLVSADGPRGNAARVARREAA